VPERPPSLARNVLTSWGVLAGNIAYGLFVTPLIVGSLAPVRYGLWSFLNGLFAYSELLYFGLGSALVKFVAESHARGDRGRVNRLGSVVVTIYGTLGVLSLAVAVAISGLLPRLIAGSLPIDVERSASIACVLLGVRLLTVFVGSAFSGLLAGHDRFDVVNAVHAAALGARWVAVPLLLPSAGDPLVMLAGITVAVGIGEAVALAVLAYRFVPQLDVRPVRPAGPELALLYGFGLQSFFILLSAKINSYTDTTVIGVMLGAASVAFYALPLQLLEYGRMAIGGFAGVFLPRLTALATRGDRDGLGAELVRASRIAFFLAAWIVGTLVALGPAFLSLWIGPEFGPPARWVLIWLGVATGLHVLISTVPLAFYQALHLLARPAIVFFVEAIANLVLSVVLAPRYGIAGVAFGTALPVPFISFALLPPYLCRHLGLPLRSFLRGAMTAGGLLLIVNLGMQWALQQLIGDGSYGALVVRGLSTLPLAALVFVGTFPRSDRRSVIAALWSAIPVAAAPRSQ
jgi:O-antigen/teichoic acid export membrane protein